MVSPAGFIIIGAVSFSQLESDWDFIDALYYSTVTATTIGFGDMVPTITIDGGGIFKALYVILYITFSKCQPRSILTPSYLPVIIDIVLTSIGVADISYDQIGLSLSGYE